MLSPVSFPLSAPPPALPEAPENRPVSVIPPLSDAQKRKRRPDADINRTLTDSLTNALGIKDPFPAQGS